MATTRVSPGNNKSLSWQQQESLLAFTAVFGSPSMEESCIGFYAYLKSLRIPSLLRTEFLLMDFFAVNLLWTQSGIGLFAYSWQVCTVKRAKSMEPQSHHHKCFFVFFYFI